MDTARLLGRLWILPRCPEPVVAVIFTGLPDAIRVSVGGGPPQWGRITHLP